MQILLLGPKDPLHLSRRILLQRAGYQLSETHDAAEAIRNSAWNGCNLVVLSSRVLLTHRRRIQNMASRAGVAVLDLSNRSNGKPARHSLSHTPEAFLEMVGEAAMASHRHPEVEGDNVAWVDRERRYLHVTDGFLNIIGYDRDEVIGRYIEDFTYPGTANAPKEFQRYLADGSMTGRYSLRHKSGKKVAVEFHAGVLEDGCMYSSLKPLDGSDSEKC
jgi:PAS domain S-box-containing protein